MKLWFCTAAAIIVAAAACSSGQRPADQPPVPSSAPSPRARTFEFLADPAPGASASAAPSASAPATLLSKESVRGVIRAHYSDIRACYEKELAKKPGLHGTVTARFMIAEDGSVATVDMASSKLPSARAVECIGEIFRVMKFPAPPSGMILISYPIDLLPEVTTEWK